MRLYEDILGFRLYKIKSEGKDSFSYQVFGIPENGVIRSVYLYSPTQTRSLTLTEVRNVHIPEAPAMSTSVMVIRVDDLNYIRSEVESIGLKCGESKIGESSGLKFQQQILKDFDSHVLLLFQLI